MNQKCKVCGEPAAGFHFGAFTCEGCKSFFGRTYSNVSAIGECKNGGQCVINKKNRTSCKACRLRKCLLVGMSKSGSRYGRRSNWFKIHCLLQEQTGMDQPMVPGMFGGNSSSHHDVKEEDEDEMMDEDVPERTNSTSSRSQSPGGALSREDCEDHHHNSMASKENLRSLMMLSSSSRSPVESPCSFTKHRPTSTFKQRRKPSPQPGLLAIPGNSPFATSVIHPARTSSPKFDHSGTRHHTAAEVAAAHLYQLYQQQQLNRMRHISSSSMSPTTDSSINGDLPEQESPIDLSCKSSASSSPVSSSHLHPSAVCAHIRAEISLSSAHSHDQLGQRESPATPLDLTTKG